MTTSAELLNPTWYATYAPDHNQAGQTISREVICECRRSFTQYLLSSKQLALWEKRGVMPNILRQIPELYVPVHCPPCESKDLGRQSRIDAARQQERVAWTVPDRDGR